jgi:hypothetical protein
MTCERAQPLISALIDGEVTAAERERVLAHLRTCPHCATLYDDYRRLRRSMRDLPPVSPPPQLAEATWRRIAADGRAPGHWRGRVRALAGGALAIAAALLVAVPLGGIGSDGADRMAALLGRPLAEATITAPPQRQVVEPAVPPTASATRPAPTATATVAPTTRPAPPLVALDPPTPSPPAPDPPTPVATITVVDDEPTATPRPAAPPRAATATRPPATATSVPVTRTVAPSLTATPAPRTAAATKAPATSTATRVPPTAAAPTRTPPPAVTPTATRPPAPVVGASFAAALSANPGVRTRLGAPIQSERGGEGQTQSFERGQMESITEPKQITVLYRDGHTWARFADTWSPDEVVTPGEPPPPGLHRPRRAFGKLWRENATVRERLGWATAPDQTSSARLQRFERGQLVKSSGATYALFEDGAWERLD